MKQLEPHSTPEGRASAFAGRFVGRPLAILPSVLEGVRDGRYLAGLIAAAKPIDTPMENGNPAPGLAGVAVVPISGPLFQQAWSFFGLVSFDGYDSIQSRVKAAMDSADVSAVVIAIDSPGGEVAGMFEACRAMRAMSDASGKPIVAYAGEMACSAAYCMASAAEAIVCPDSGMVGSIGVLSEVDDVSKALEMRGVSVHMIASGDRKTDGHPEIPFTDDARKAIQARVDHLADVFFGEVSKSRPGMSPADVKGLEAGVFTGSQAMRAGLVDVLGTLDDAIALARSMATKSAPANRATKSQGRGAPRKERANMLELLIAALGLKSDASEAEALGQVHALKGVVAATGKSTPAEAIGVIEAGKAALGRVATLEAEVQKQAQTAEAKERTELIAQGRADHKLTPAQIEKWVPTQTTASLRAFLEVTPKGSAVPIGSIAEPPHGASNPNAPTPTAPGGVIRAQCNGKTFDEMTNAEFARLAEDEVGTYKGMLAECARRGISPFKPAKKRSA